MARLRAAGSVLAEDEARLLVEAAASPVDLADMVQRRTAGVPLEHVLGWVDFCGQRVSVDEGVFVPRQRTAFLVQQAVAVATPRATIVDLCCGSGAVGVALAARAEQIELHAVDLDPAAVRCARGNVAAIAGVVYEGDLFQPLPAGLRGRFDIVVANAPYVPTAAIRLMPAEARLHEPRLSLDGGVDGLDILRRIIAAAPGWLAPGGHLLIETSQAQAPDLVEPLARSGLSARTTRSAELAATVVIGARPRVV